MKRPGFMQLFSGKELEDIIRAARADRAALEQLLAHYQPYLRLIAEQAIGPAIRRREDASDAVQKTLIEASQDCFRGATEPEFTAWIRQILHRNILNLVRDNRAARRDHRREQYQDDGSSSAVISWQFEAKNQTSPSLRLIKAEAALNLAHALGSLPAEQRAAVVMRHLEGRSIDEIAESMEKTPAAVAGLIRRAVSRLRATMADDTPI